jgi:putative transcriptional regulator
MNAFKTIRLRLKVTQAALAEALRVTQGNVSFYEKGQTVPPAVAARLIQFSRERGEHLTFDDIYAPAAMVGVDAAADSAPAPAAAQETSHAA